MVAEDKEVRVAMGVVALVVAITLAVVLGWAVRTSQRAEAPATVGASPEPMALQDVETVTFAAGASAVPVEAQEVLARVADAARAEPARRVYIDARLEPGQDVAVAAAAAAARAQALAHALEAWGVPRAQLMVEPPLPVAGTDDGLAVALRVR